MAATSRKNNGGIKVHGRNMPKLKFADDIDLLERT